MSPFFAMAMSFGLLSPVTRFCSIGIGAFRSTQWIALPEADAMYRRRRAASTASPHSFAPIGTRSHCFSTAAPPGRSRPTKPSVMATWVK